MASTRIPFRNTGYFSPLICDLIEGHPALDALIARPVELAGFELQIAEKQMHYAPDKRQALVKALRNQYKTVNRKETAEKQITRLEKATTFTVTTGHQLNLFTGPLYFFIKSFRPLIFANSSKSNIHITILYPYIGWQQKTTILRRLLIFIFKEESCNGIKKVRVQLGD